MTTEPILSKGQNLEHVLRGDFGNQWPTCNTLAELLALPLRPDDKCVLRYKGVGGQWCKYFVPFCEIEGVVQEWERQGASRAKIYGHPPPPHLIPGLVIQGEYWVNPGGRDVLFYSTWPEPMRIALKHDPKTVEGLVAEHLLRYHMTASSWADFELLRERYVDHVLEVSVWGACVGDTPGRNAIVWEVRRY